LGQSGRKHLKVAKHRFEHRDALAAVVDLEQRHSLKLDSVGVGATWDDEYLTVAEVAERLKLNQQTVRNWIDQGSLPAVRVGRRVRVRRSDLDRILAQGATAASDPRPAAVAPAEAIEQLAQALDRAHRLLRRRSAVRRAELAEGLQELADAVETALQLLSNQSSPPDEPHL
jgi:excisionase family DNA binding protein